MNRIALGTVQFGLPYGIANRVGQVTRQEAKMMLQMAATHGVDILDTAIDYGESETSLGVVGTQGFKIVTKLPAVPSDCADVSSWVKAQVNASLARLGVSAVYGLLLHRSEQLRGPHGAVLYQAMQDLKDNGQVQKMGVSIYSPSELDALIPQYRFDLVQAPFNLVDRRLFTTGWLQRLKDSSVEVHTRSVFLQGLLLMTNANMPAKFAPWSSLWHRWQLWLKEMGSSSVQTCLAFPLSFPGIDRIVVGVDSVSQLSQILGSITSYTIHDFPALQCEDENLINPANWPSL
ncbi:aldo/keto reductase [Desulfosediminicola sp.]|uniref:aldo/keto reductase n=1 Tax=Desulfosediminicola sp. TaxID=2886825 RepID=UPI003AF2913A